MSPTALAPLAPGIPPLPVSRALEREGKDRLPLWLFDETPDVLPASVQHYILSTWRASSPRASVGHAAKVAEAVLSNHGTRVGLAFFREPAAGATAEFIVSWLVYGPGIAHYVYTRARYRRAGAARLLVANSMLTPGVVPVTAWNKDLGEAGFLSLDPHLFVYAGTDLGPRRIRLAEGP